MVSGLNFGRGPALTKVGHDIAAKVAILNDRIPRGTMRERSRRTQNAMKARKYLGSRRAERRFSRAQVRPQGAGLGSFIVNSLVPKPKPWYSLGFGKKKKVHKRQRALKRKKRRGGSKIEDIGIAKLKFELKEWKKNKRQIQGYRVIEHLPDALKIPALRLLPRPMSLANFKGLNRRMDFRDQIESCNDNIAQIQKLITKGHP